jgi:hypothetical protein
VQTGTKSEHFPDEKRTVQIAGRFSGDDQNFRRVAVWLSETDIAITRYPADFLRRQLRKHRQGKHFRGAGFRDGQAFLRTVHPDKDVLPVQRHRIVNGRGDARGGKRVGDGLAVFNAQGELVIDMRQSGRSVGRRISRPVRALQ